DSGTSNYLRSVFFTDANTGWAVGGSGTILATTNGGNTWVAQSCPVTNDLTSVVFADTKNGWITTFYGSNASGYILRTTDGGNNWVIQQQAPYPDLTGLQAISFGDANTGIAVGDYGITLVTKDGGNTWSLLSSSAELT